MRLRPVASLSIPKHTAVNIIEQRPPSDGVEGLRRHLAHRVVLPATSGQGEEQGRFVDPLRGAAKSAVLWIEGIAEVLGQPRLQVESERRRAIRNRPGWSERRLSRAGARRQLLVAGGARVCNLPQ